MRKYFILPVLVAAAVSVGACGVGPDKSREDAHDTTRVNKESPEAIAFNNHYPNVEHKCDGHGHRVFVTTSKSILVIPDPSCPGYTAQTAEGITSNNGN